MFGRVDDRVCGGEGHLPSPASPAILDLQDDNQRLHDHNDTLTTDNDRPHTDNTRLRDAAPRPTPAPAADRSATPTTAAARGFQNELAYYRFVGWRHAPFGDTYAHGTDGVAFFTRAKAITSRWLDPSHGGLNLGFVQNAFRHVRRVPQIDFGEVRACPGTPPGRAPSPPVAHAIAEGEAEHRQLARAGLHLAMLIERSTRR